MIEAMADEMVAEAILGRALAMAHGIAALADPRRSLGWTRRRWARERRRFNRARRGGPTFSAHVVDRLTAGRLP